jgi:hypothetical protein
VCNTVHGFCSRCSKKDKRKDGKKVKREGGRKRRREGGRVFSQDPEFSSQELPVSSPLRLSVLPARQKWENYVVKLSSALNSQPLAALISEEVSLAIPMNWTQGEERNPMLLSSEIAATCVLVTHRPQLASTLIP